MVSRHAEAQPEEISFAGAADDTDLATALAADVLLALASNNVRPFPASAAGDDVVGTIATARGRASNRTRLQPHPDALRGVSRVLRKQQSSDDVRAILHNAVFLMRGFPVSRQGARRCGACLGIVVVGVNCLCCPWFPCRG